MVKLHVHMHHRVILGLLYAYTMYSLADFFLLLSS